MSITIANINTKIHNNLGTNSTSFTGTNMAIDINLGIDNLLLMLFGEGSGGSWQLDDSNQTDYPIITTNLVANQRDYAFTTDGSSNLILDIYKVLVKGSATAVYKEIPQRDQQSYDKDTPDTYLDGQSTTGIPTTFDLTGNGIFLDPIPNTSVTNGLKVLINRESTYFTNDDINTGTKKWGYTGLYHEYLVLYTSYQYARAKSLPNAEQFKRDLIELENKIKKHSGLKNRSMNNFITPSVADYK